MNFVIYWILKKNIKFGVKIQSHALAATEKQKVSETTPSKSSKPIVPSRIETLKKKLIAEATKERPALSELPIASKKGVKNLINQFENLNQIKGKENITPKQPKSPPKSSSLKP